MKHKLKHFTKEALIALFIFSPIIAYWGFFYFFGVTSEETNTH